MKRRYILRIEQLEDRLAPAAGSLDPTFGTGGVVTLPPELSDPLFAPTAIATAPDGKVVVAGTIHPPLGSGGTNYDFAVFRLTGNGQLDTSFGGTGYVQIPFDLAGSGAPDNSYVNSDRPSGVAVDAAGRVIVVGSASDGSQNDSMAVARLTADGRLDGSFGTGGKITILLTSGGNAGVGAVALQPDGKIVLAGYDAQGIFGTSHNPPTNFAAARLTDGGQLDPTFGSGGKVSVPFPVGMNTVAYANALALSPDGFIALAGQAATSTYVVAQKNIANVFETAVMRLTPTGQLDTSFGDGGRVRVGFGDAADSDWAQDVGVLGDGRIVVAGTDRQNDANAFRLTAGGQLDASYDGDGRVSIPGTSGWNSARGMVQSDGRVTVLQQIAPDMFPPTQPNGVRVLGLTVDGGTDPAYPAGNLIPDTYFQTAAVQPGGNIVLAGTAGTYGVGPFSSVVARVIGSPKPPAGFVPASAGAIAGGGAANGTFQVLTPTGGTYAAAGTTTAYVGFPGNVRTTTADVNGDGTPDYVVAAGPGGLPAITVFDGATGAVLADFLAFESSFSGGVFVAAADLDGDGRAEIVATPDQGGGGRVTAFAVAGGAATPRASFFGIDDPNFRGGARLALGDVNKDGVPDLLVAAGFGGGPRVALFDGTNALSHPTKLVNDFFAFPEDAQTLRNGVFAALGDVSGDGYADLIFGGGPGGGPRVYILSGQLLMAGSPQLFSQPVANFFVANNSSDRGGVRVAIKDADGDAKADVVAGSGEGSPAKVRVYLGANFTSTAEPGTFQDIGVFGGNVLPSGVYVG